MRRDVLDLRAFYATPLGRAARVMLARKVEEAWGDTRGLDANEAFAKAHGFGGTPVIVRPSDGAVIEGYRPAAALRAFLTAAPSNPKG